MDISFQPKSQLDQVKQETTIGDVAHGIGGFYIGEKKSIATIVLTLLVFVSFGSIIGVYFMGLSVQSEIDAKKAQLVEKNNQVAVFQADDIRALSARLNMVDKAVKAEPFITTFLKVLESSIEDGVTFKRTSLNDTRTGFDLTIDAETKSYGAIINQLQSLKEKPVSDYYSKVLIRNVSIDKKGVIAFKIEASVGIRGKDPDSVNFDTTGSTTSQADQLQVTTPSKTGLPDALPATP